MPQESPSVFDAVHSSPEEERFYELREVLFGEYIDHLEGHRQRIIKLEEGALEASQNVAKQLSKAAKNDPKVRRTLYPAIEDCIRMSVEENPSMMAGILFPIIGEAVRKAVAHAVQQMMDSMNNTLSDSFSAERLKWRVEAWRSGKSYAEIALTHSVSYRVEHIYVIHRTTGLLLGQVTAQSNLLQDSDMVVGMLTAIQDFVRDSFTSDQKEDLDVIQVGQFKIWLQHGPIALLAAVISGQPKPALRGVLVEQVEHIHRNFQLGMARFETTGQAIPGLEEGLGECLVEEQKKPSAPQSYTKFKVAGVIFLLLFCAATFYYGRRAIYWNDYVERLRHQPGIVVVEERRDWTSLFVRGLRDPMAIDPRSVLERYHLETANVDEHWEPYYSLDPRFANVRRLNNEADLIRKESVRFQLDATTLPIDQLALVDTIGDQIQELAADAARQKRRIHVQLLGHTDRSGSSEHNIALSQQRAEAIVRFLVGRGIDSSLLSAAGVGDTQLGYNQDIEEGRDLDRRVTFSVELR